MFIYLGKIWKSEWSRQESELAPMIPALWCTNLKKPLFPFKYALNKACEYGWISYPWLSDYSVDFEFVKRALSLVDLA